MLRTAILAVVLLVSSQALAFEKYSWVWEQASWYGESFEGRTMANGELFDPKQIETAAHKSLPFGTIVLVKNVEKNRELTVVIKDRGPFVSGRAFDLSKAGAEYLGYLKQGVIMLQVKILFQP